MDTALDHLAIAMDKGSLKDARFAVQYAEEAFFDPTLVPQLYFPTEHMIGKLANTCCGLRETFCHKWTDL